MTDARYTWTDFYSEFADKLLHFRNDRQTLIAKLQKVYAGIGMKFPTLESDGRIPDDIDPFTVFGLFNKGITDINRKKVVTGLADEFGVAAPQPAGFDGLPVLNNLNATFYAFSNDSRRGESDIDNLWDVFTSAVTLGDEDSRAARDSFISAYDRTAGQFGLGWKLTMGLYWTRPFAFLSLDSRNRWYIGDMAHAGTACSDAVPRSRSKTIPTGEEYLSICETVRAELGTAACPQESLPELSYAAWLESERVNRLKTEEVKAKEKAAQDASLGDGDVETVDYWLYTPGLGAQMWDEFVEQGAMGLDWGELGDLRAFDTKDSMRRKLQELHGGVTSEWMSGHAAWQFVHELKPGDIVFAKRGKNEILGRGVVAGDYVYDKANGDYPNRRKVNWTHTGSWQMDRNFTTKMLTKITDFTEQVAQIESLFEGEGIEDSGGEQAGDYPVYAAEDFLSEVYMDESSYETLTGVLRSKKNVILQGAPGVGKTFVAKRLAYSMMGTKDPSRVMMVQFHQSYSYEDFIEGYRPSAEGFELVKGAFYTFCKKAAEDEDNDYFFIIDEINRGNLSKIFGELFMLIENDKRGPKNKLQLLYSRELFHVPSNVYLIGMMNTADRSLAMLDYALRRRFAFFDLNPGFASDGFREYRAGLSSPKFDALVQAVERLNGVICEDESLGEGFQIGHSYFCNLDATECDDAKLASIVDYELVPMLKEYWFDEPVKVRDWANRLHGALH